MYEQSHRDYLRSGYLHHHLPVMGCLIMPVTPWPAQSRAAKYWELKLANAAITDMQMRQRDALALDAKYTKKVSPDAKSWKWYSAWWCCRWSSSVAHQSSLSIQCVEATTASGVDNAASPTGEHAEQVISPSEESWSLCKNNWKEPRSILANSADRVAHISGQLMQLL